MIDCLRHLTRRSIPFLFLFAGVVCLQAWSGAFVAELSGADEPAHFITGLLIRDYVAAGLPSDPLAFATNYYTHYPKVAFGIWPPLFHVVEAVWMLVFPVSRVSILMLMALLTSLLAMSLYLVARRSWGPFAGMGVALLFVMLPTTQQGANSVLADTQVALLGFSATLCWARYMDSARWQDATAFGVLGSLCLLTKGNGIALFAVPLLSALIAGRWRLVTSRTFWLGPSIMVLVGGPWQLYSWRMIQTTVTFDPSMWKHARLYAQMIAEDTGVGVLACAVAGLAAIMARRLNGRPIQNIAATMAALPAAVLLFHIAAPLEPSSRYLLSALPAILWLSVYGIAWASRRFDLVPGLGPAGRGLALASGAAAVFVATAFTISWKAHYGFTEIAEYLLQRPDCGRCVVLASSRGNGGGMLIAEFAMREARPGHIVLRAEKMLSRSTWHGARYELLYADAGAVEDYLESVPVDFVVIDESVGGDLRHHDLLTEAVARGGDRWHLANAIRSEASGSQPILVYGASRQKPAGEDVKVAIDMKYTLGRAIRKVQ